MNKIILASASKRRSKILTECGIPHKVMVSNAPEIMIHKKGPDYNVVFNARKKAEAVSKKVKAGYVIGVDTLVLLGSKLIGKPKNRNDAKRKFKSFSGKKISIHTGLCIIDAKKQRVVTGFEVSGIKVEKISPKQLDEFISILGPHDKAGGFSIEGAGSLIFDNVKGSFYNILGLPMITLNSLFKKLGVDLLKYIKK